MPDVQLRLCNSQLSNGCDAAAGYCAQDCIGSKPVAMMETIAVVRESRHGALWS